MPSFTNEQCAHPDWRGCLVRSCMLCAGDINADPCDGDSGKKDRKEDTKARVFNFAPVIF